ncbi:hypothetical protein LCI18_014509 [Fusarium solani-melongenae]|uniref:Uncharacterized protein n=1 Tax=Fusarium solani subsp. cucurbitae TaxID=2747967 RepID=A0ACD3ZQG2_FUSSC|nr:hypothetical protein LCI18_014509 [Fusarium solani-melongenae]
MDANASNANMSRRVGNLTAEQAEKKRAIDRDNQRHHRAKNKAYIRTLEDKIAELTARLAEAEALLEQYRARDNEQLPPLSHSSATDWTASTQPTSTDGEVEASTSVPLLSEESIKTYLDSLPLDLGAGMTIHSFGAAQNLNFLDWDLAGVMGNLSPPMEAQSTDLPSYDTTLGSWDSTSSQNRTPEWQMMPLYIPATTKLDEVIISTAAAWRARLHKDEELEKPAFPSINSLLNRPSNIEQGLPGTFSETVAAQVWRSPIKTLPERIGFMYNLSHLIRWLVCRTKETYEKMPPFLRPTELQRTVPHAAWISMITSPDARDALIKHMDLSRFEEIRILGGESLSVSWPYPDSAAFVESPDKQSLMLHPAFEAHLRRRENWVVSKEVCRAFPFLEPFINWRE